MTTPFPRWLPDVRAVAQAGDAQARLSLHVPETLACFEGHFPGLPILPGVVQLDWVVRLARVHLPAFGREVHGVFQTLDNIKFLAVVLPGMSLELDLAWQAGRRQLGFSYARSGRVHASGRLGWGEPA